MNFILKNEYHEMCGIFRLYYNYFNEAVTWIGFRVLMFSKSISYALQWQKKHQNDGSESKISVNVQNTFFKQNFSVYESSRHIRISYKSFNDQKNILEYLHFRLSINMSRTTWNGPKVDVKLLGITVNGLSPPGRPHRNKPT